MTETQTNLIIEALNTREGHAFFIETIALAMVNSAKAIKAAGGGVFFYPSHWPSPSPKGTQE